jgi:hypothetical protein
MLFLFDFTINKLKTVIAKFIKNKIAWMILNFLLNYFLFFIDIQRLYPKINLPMKNCTKCNAMNV